MVVYTKVWWKRMFASQEKSKKVNILNDIRAIRESLQDVPTDVGFLQKELVLLEELEKEYKVAKSGIVQVNLQTQADHIEKILERYESFQNDVDINGLRVKMIAQEFLKRAAKADMKDLVKAKKKERRWTFKWEVYFAKNIFFTIFNNSKFNYPTKILYFSLPESSDRTRLTMICLGSGNSFTLFLISSKLSNGFAFRASRTSHICFFPTPGSNSS